jgi:hypothetical protein
VTEPSRNSVSSLTGNGFSTLVTPWQKKRSRPSWRTPTAAPGMWKRVAVSATKSLFMPEMLEPRPGVEVKPGLAAAGVTAVRPQTTACRRPLSVHYFR